MRGIVISELLIEEPDEAEVRNLIAQVREAEDPAFLMAYYPPGSFQRNALERVGFGHAARSGSNIVVNPLSGQLPVDPVRVENWALSLGDLEFF